MNPVFVAVLLAASGSDADTEVSRLLPDPVDSVELRAPDEAPVPVSLSAGHERVRDEWWLGPRLGVATAFDSDDVAFAAGVQLRVRLLSWLWVEAAIDVHTTQSYDHDQIRVSEVPMTAAALFFLPVEWAVKPYALAGAGLNISHITYHDALSARNDQTSANPIWLQLGFGAQVDLTSSIMLDADLRFAFVDTPGGVGGNSFQFLQFTVGIAFKIGG
jgi:opacity protein-like surface antigen